MFFKQIYNRPLSQYSYLIGCEKTKEALLIDPVRLLDVYEKVAEEEGLTITGVTETHIHADYASGLRDAAAYFDAVPYVSAAGEDDKWAYQNMPDSTIYLKDGDVVTVGEQIHLQVLSTPGHTPESLSFVLTDKGARSIVPMGIFTGDFLFVSDIGRPDLLEKTDPEDESSREAAADMFESIQKMGDYRCFMQIWPGHGAGSPCGKAIGKVPITTLGYERRNNRAFKLKDKKEKFIDELLEGQPEPPTYFAQMKKVNQEGLLPPFQLKDIPLAQENGFSGQIFDLRPREEFAKGFIKEAVNIPYNDQFLNFMGWFVDYEEPMAVIANPDDIDAIQRGLALIGYDQLACIVPADQIDAYLNASYEWISPEEFLALEEDDLQVLDVRDDTEWEEGHVPGAVNRHFGLLADEELDLNPKEPVYVYCQSGVRTGIAASVLSGLGYADIYSIEGGYNLLEKELQEID